MGTNNSAGLSLRAWLAQQQKTSATAHALTVTEKASSHLSRFTEGAKTSLWRKFNCAALLDLPVCRGQQKTEMTSLEAALPQADVLEAKVVLVDGLFCPELSRCPTGLVVTTAPQDALDGASDWLHFVQQLSPDDTTGSMAWVLSPHVLDVQIAADMHVEIVFQSTSSTVTAACLSIQLADNVHAHCRQTWVEERQVRGMFLSNTMLTLGRGARLEQRIYTNAASQSAWMHTQRARLERDAVLVHAQLFAGGRMLRQCLGIELLGQRASAHVTGMGLGDCQTCHDMTMTVDHLASMTHSSQDVKYVVRQKACSHFGSRVVVNKKIKDVQSNQLNHNLLLDKTARALTAPELEVYADEVQCAHGATIGSLDEKALFYLQQRGLRHAAAQSLLVEGFVNAQLSKFPVANRELAFTIARRYLAQLGQGF